MNQENNPSLHKISLEEILNKSFFYWKSTLGFQFIITVLYFGIILLTLIQLSQYYFGDTVYEYSQKFLENPKLYMEKINAMMLTENGGYFQMIMALVKAAMFPLNIGLFKIYGLIDEKKTPQLSDVLDGYSGSNFFKFWGYSIFFNVVLQVGVALFFVPGLIWILVTLFVSPLLYFTPMRMIEAIQLSAKVVFANLAIILPCVLVAVLFKYSGLVVFFIGYLFTFPFWNAIIYTLFKKFFNIKFV